jgi:hypothetical protein
VACLRQSGGHRRWDTFESTHEMISQAYGGYVMPRGSGRPLSHNDSLIPSLAHMAVTVQYPQNQPQLRYSPPSLYSDVKHEKCLPPSYPVHFPLPPPRGRHPQPIVAMLALWHFVVGILLVDAHVLQWVPRYWGPPKRDQSRQVATQG